MALRPWATPCGSGRRSKADHRLPQIVLERNGNLPVSRELFNSSKRVKRTAHTGALLHGCSGVPSRRDGACLAPCQPPPTCPEATSEDATAPFRSALCAFLHLGGLTARQCTVLYFATALKTQTKLSGKNGLFLRIPCLMVHQIIWSNLEFLFSCLFPVRTGPNSSLLSPLPTSLPGTLKCSLDPARQST